MRHLIATDTGGTFTDVATFDLDTGQVRYGKTLTNYENLVAGALDGLAETGVQLRDGRIFKHGTTHVINTLIERTGGNTALVATRGFADLLEIGRGNRPVPFALGYRRSPPLIERTNRYEVKERMGADGSVLEALDMRELAELAEVLNAAKFDAVAVAFVNAYANPVHEDQAMRFLKEVLPQVYVTSGTTLTREWSEYERVSTAAANAYVGASMSGYVATFDERLREEGFSGSFFMMGSNGGVLSRDRAIQQPVALVESGPIGGCLGAATYADALGISRVIAFDMGGTTAKCALVLDGKFDVQPVYYVGGYEYGFPLKTPVLDIVEIGTGGGSIASVDKSGRLAVGPRSAGSEPGPVAFGRGGTEPTVTDANLVLGRISAHSFMQGRLKMNAEASAQAILTKVAGPLGYQGEDAADRAAQGILDIATASMVSVIKEISVERGHDVREFTLLPFGGGGPLFASILARQLRIPKIVVPPHPGNFSAIGMLLAGARIDLSRMVVAPAAPGVLPRLLGAFDALEREAAATMLKEMSATEVRFERSLEMRYRGQKHTVRVEFDPAVDLPSLLTSFEEVYARRYGHCVQGSAIEILDVRLGAIAKLATPDLAQLTKLPALQPAGPSARRGMYFPQPIGRIATDVWQRAELPQGFSVDGPAVIEEFSSTTVLLPGDRATVGALGELVIVCGPQ